MTSAWANAARILCVRLDALGDVIMSSPAIRALKQARPGRSITLLSSAAGCGAAALLPEIDEWLVYQAPWVKSTAAMGDARTHAAFIGELRAGRFDAAVIFTTYTQSALPAALYTMLAGIPLRLGFARENPYHLLSDWIPEREPQHLQRHEVQRQLDLVGAVGVHAGQDSAIRLAVGAAATRRMEAVLRKSGLLRNRPYVVLHPGASAPSRRYRPEGFGRVARLLTAAGLQVVVTGAQGEEALAAVVTRHAPAAVSLVGLLDVTGLAALIGSAALLLANNSGPVHIAAGMGTPVVVLYALTNPQHTPWKVPSRVLSHEVECKSCYKSVCPLGHNDCLQKLDPAEIAEACLEILRSRQSEPSVAPPPAPLPDDLFKDPRCSP